MLRVPALVQAEFFNEAPSQVAAAAFSEHGVLGVDRHALLVGVFPLPLGRQTHVARRHPLHAAIVVEQDFCGGKPRIDLHFQGLGLLCQPAADIPQADDVVAMVAHAGRRQEARDADGGALVSEEINLVLFDRRPQGRIPLPPVRDQFIQGAGVQHGPGEDMGANFGAFFQQADAQGLILALRQVFQVDGGCQASRAGADHQHVVFHDFAGHGESFTGSPASGAGRAGRGTTGDAALLFHPRRR